MRSGKSDRNALFLIYGKSNHFKENEIWGQYTDSREYYVTHVVFFLSGEELETSREI